jgi:hypothetical protein
MGGQDQKRSQQMNDWRSRPGKLSARGAALTLVREPDEA